MKQPRLQTVQHPRNSGDTNWSVIRKPRFWHLGWLSAFHVPWILGMYSLLQWKGLSELLRHLAAFLWFTIIWVMKGDLSITHHWSSGQWHRNPFMSQNLQGRTHPNSTAFAQATPKGFCHPTHWCPGPFTMDWWYGSVNIIPSVHCNDHHTQFMAKRL